MSEPQRDPAGFTARIEQYLEWSKIKGHSPETTRRVKSMLNIFARWCAERSVLRPSEITRAIIERYQRHLFYSINKHTKQPLSLAGHRTRLASLKVFFAWLSRQHMIAYNPAADMEIPRRIKNLPRQVLTASEADQVMNQANIRTPDGLRDRAIMEVFYSTGVRRTELRNLSIKDIDIERGVLNVYKGKGGKDRVVPLSERAALWIRSYLTRSRPAYDCGISEGALFLSNQGKKISNNAVSALVKKYLDLSGVGKHGSCHLFRHTCATLMLEGGADVRYIQALLGHENVSTTEIYTHVVIKKLKEVHALTHPGAKLKQKAETKSPK